VSSDTVSTISGRERLLATAAVMFRQRGYAGTSTRDLAAALGMQSASLYHYIGSKEDLLFDLSREALEVIGARVAAALDGAEDPVERLRLLIRTHLVTALSDQDKHAVMLTEMHSLSPARRAEVLKMRDQYEAYVEGVLSKARGAGVIRTDIPVKYLRLALLDLLGWTIFWFRPDGELSPNALADIMVTLYLDGARWRPAQDWVAAANGDGT